MRSVPRTVLPIAAQLFNQICTSRLVFSVIECIFAGLLISSGCKKSALGDRNKIFYTSVRIYLWYLIIFRRRVSSVIYTYIPLIHIRAAVVGKVVIFEKVFSYFLIFFTVYNDCSRIFYYRLIKIAFYSRCKLGIQICVSINLNFSLIYNIILC